MHGADHRISSPEARGSPDMRWRLLGALLLAASLVRGQPSCSCGMEACPIKNANKAVSAAISALACND